MSQRTSSPEQNHDIDNPEQSGIMGGYGNNQGSLDANPISWKQIFHSCEYYIKNCILSHLKRQRREELQLLDHVNILLTESDDPEKVTDTCEKYIVFHRIVENTRARRRLEKWITILIALYLLGVFAIVVSVAIFNDDSFLAETLFRFKLSDAVMITLLSTTTVNIVALGIILTKGLYNEKESNDLSNEKPSDNNE